jgi:hypothetical protein
LRRYTESSQPVFTINFLLFSNGGSSLGANYNSAATGIQGVPQV